MKDKIMQCPECKGTGYIEWGVSYDEIHECEVCEGHGEWLTDDEELELWTYIPMEEKDINIMAEDYNIAQAIQEKKNYEAL
tara:strand:+ start:80 stop:322 length:243 start_codon:yes stop_codon:yes gene_type:complete